MAPPFSSVLTFTDEYCIVSQKAETVVPRVGDAIYDDGAIPEISDIPLVAVNACLYGDDVNQ